MSGYFSGSGRVPPEFRSMADNDAGSQHQREPSPERPEKRDKREYRDSRDSRDSSSQRRSRSRERSRDKDGGREDHSSRKRYRDLDENENDRRHSRDYREGRESKEPRDSHSSRGGSSRAEDNGTPCSTLVLRGLSNKASEDDVAAALSYYGSVSNVRLAKDRDTGQARGIAFVDFASVEGAKNAVESLRGYILIDGYEARIEYSREHRPPARTMDWICTSCKALNFARRTSCFKCSSARTEDAPQVDSGDASKSGNDTSDILMLKELSPLSTEESVRAALSQYASNVRMIRIVRDQQTQQSRGFCFVDVGNVKEASSLIRDSSGLLIDGCEVKISFARPKDVSNALSGGTASLRTNPFGQMAVDQAMAQQVVRPVPANVPEGFVYDERSGWYYHASTGYYFDASTSLYYEPTQGKYYSYDRESGQYVEHQQDNTKWTDDEQLPKESVAQQTAAQAAAQAAAAMADFNKKKKKKAQAAPVTGGGITAMKINISHELGKWKAQQDDVVQAREVVENEKPGERVQLSKQSSGGMSAPSPSLMEVRQVSTLHMLAEKSHHAADPTRNTSPLGATTSGEASGHAGGGGGGAVCLLCRRKFANQEQLTKHEQQSDMHKQKVEEAKRAEIAQIKQSVLASQAAVEKKVEKQMKKQHYADMARDTREQQKALREAEEAARLGKAPTERGLADNKGSDMLRKMGWSEGQGLGSKGDGILSHIGVVQREERAGIGCGEVTKEEDIVNPGDSMKNIMYKKASARMESDPTSWRQSFTQD